MITTEMYLLFGLVGILLSIVAMGITLGSLIIAGKRQLKADFQSLRDEVKNEIATLRQEVRGEIATLRQEFKSDNTALRQEFREDNRKLSDRIDKLSERIDRLTDRVNDLSDQVSHNNGLLEGLREALGYVMDNRKAAYSQ